MELRIRPATPQDYALLPEIETAADAVLNMPGLPTASSVQDYREAIMVLVAEESGKICGFARLDEVDDQSHLEQLSVPPEHGRRGIGRSLVSAAQHWAQQQGYRTMTLCTFSEVPFNAPFYARCGFVAEIPQSPGLIALRAREAALGLDALGARVVMRCAVIDRGER
ncbi:GNAT family N-acetyltransferase [Psychromicrobium xiongbiense]|uniref:GNAT family N-acetyltransferase n=1 Tax=Psychromicrobium xiongbiense TaxID=3051184 RepID=UPI002556F7E7|nr:GNAT family N-acetyltransferase [Psychromicrobium sp. YIM S02556]